MTKDDLLMAYTGRDSQYWVGRVQDLIGAYFEAEPDNPHPACDVRWMLHLTREVWQTSERHLAKPRRFERFRKPRSPYDENMLSAFLLTTILSAWAVRVSRAKAHDPRRPLALRRIALRRNRELVAALHDAIYDETQDAHYFDQPWEYPYAENATDGDFV